MSLTNKIIKNVARRVISGQDYRIEIVAAINAQFLDFALDFFKSVINAKLKNKDITIDWYKKTFLDDSLPKEDIVINSGLNVKTVGNMFNSVAKRVCIDAANEHYEALYDSIQQLIKENDKIDIELTITFNKVSVDLNLSESLIVINTLAVKRAAIRGGAWSEIGKKVEKILMFALCKLFKVDKDYYTQTDGLDSFREIDFYLKDKDGNNHKCEVKLMGKGNPESADAIFARQSQILVADKLSDKNKRQAEQLNCQWVALRDENGYQRFGDILKNLQIPHSDFNGNLETRLNEILSELLD